VVVIFLVVLLSLQTLTAGHIYQPSDLCTIPVKAVYWWSFVSQSNITSG